MRRLDEAMADDTNFTALNTIYIKILESKLFTGHLKVLRNCWTTFCWTGQKTYLFIAAEMPKQMT